MNTKDFETSYKILRDRLGKKLITDSYIENIAYKFKVDQWNEDLAKEVFEDLSVADPYKVDISAGSVTSLYWQKFKDKRTNSFSKNACSKNLCNGQGLVVVYQDHYIDSEFGDYG